MTVRENLLVACDDKDPARYGIDLVHPGRPVLTNVAAAAVREFGLEADLEAMPDVVKKMHAASGLTDEVRASTVTVPEAEQMVLDYVRKHVKSAGAAPLAGNSIATDRGFIARDMTALDTYLHYRMIDVSSIKELSRRWYPRIYFGQPEKGLAHRALADIRESIEEMRYYRDAMLVPRPGPDTATCKEIAARHQGTLTPAAPTVESGIAPVTEAGTDVVADESAATAN